MPPLTEIIYVSAARSPFSPAALRDLLSVSRRNNARAGVTGMLIHAEGSFLQVLEGTAESVAAIYARIERDPRHLRLLRLFHRQKAERNFGEWTMGFVEPSSLASPPVSSGRGLPGFNDFFRSGFAHARFNETDAERIRDLAYQFGKGRWRQHVQVSDTRRDAL